MRQNTLTLVEDINFTDISPDVAYDGFVNHVSKRCDVDFVEKFRLMDIHEQSMFLVEFSGVELDNIGDKCLELFIATLEADAYDHYCVDEYRDNAYMLLHKFRTELEKRIKLDEYLRTIEDDGGELENADLVNNNLPKLMRRYGMWVRDDIMLPFAVDGVVKGYLGCKRGNRAYVKAMEARIKELEGAMPTVRFFDTSNPSDRKRRSTPALNFTLTYDPKICSRYGAWDKVSKDLNLYLANLRKKYGRLTVYRSYEAHKSGYPHLNVMVLFENNNFTVFYGKYKNNNDRKRGGAWRVNGKSVLASMWPHGYADVVAVSSVDGVMDTPEGSDPNSFPLMHSVKYMTKDYRKPSKDPESSKGFLQMAIMWKLRKRAYSFSTSHSYCRKCDEHKNKHYRTDGICKDCGTELEQINLFIKSLTGVAGRLDWTIKANSNPDLEKDFHKSSEIIFFGCISYYNFELETKWKPPDDLSFIIPPEVVQKMRC